MTQTRAAITTILFTDLVGSTELLQQVGDEQGQRIFQQHHKLLSDVVTTTSGQELQWLGDGLMAAFPSTADAVRSAVAMQRASAQPVLGHRLDIRVGLNVGEVLTQDSGGPYFGTPLVVARRLCDRAGARQILCSSTVAGLLSGRKAFRFRDLGPLALKGIAAPVPVSEVLYDTESPTGFLTQTPFVGRRDELARLTHHLECAEREQGGLVMVVGEPGIGKTRTTEEFAAQARERGARVLWGRCYEGEGAPPYGPFAEAIGEYAARADADELRADHPVRCRRGGYRAAAQGTGARPPGTARPATGRGTLSPVRRGRAVRAGDRTPRDGRPGARRPALGGWWEHRAAAPPRPRRRAHPALDRRGVP